MISSLELDSFIRLGKENGAMFMLVLFDMEDKDYYPVFFNSEKDLMFYKNNIISETKCRVEVEYSL